MHSLGEQVLDHQRACPLHGPHEVLAWFIGGWRRAGACTGPDVPDPSATPDPALADLIGLLAEQLHRTGVPTHQARPVAVAAVAAMEGVQVLRRQAGGAPSSPAPFETAFDDVAAQLMRLLP